MPRKKTFDEYNAPFKKYVFTHFSKEEIKHVEAILGLYKKAQMKCRIKKITSALLTFRRADIYFDKMNFNAKQKVYIDMYRYPNIAYKFYKLEDFENAIKYGYKSISCLNEFEKEFKFMNLNKVHQAHNLTKIFLKQKRYEEYFNWTSYLLVFLTFDEILDGDNKLGLLVDLIPLLATESVAIAFNDVFLELMINFNVIGKIPYEKLSIFDPFIKRKSEIDPKRSKVFYYFIQCLSSINNNISNKNESVVDKLFKPVDSPEYIYVKILLYTQEIRKLNQLKNSKNTILNEHIQKKLQIALNKIDNEKHLELIKLKLSKNGILRSPNKSAYINKSSLYPGENKFKQAYSI